MKFDIGEYAFGVHGHPNLCSPRIRLRMGRGRGALAFTLTEPLLVRARFVGRLGDDGGTAECGIAPSRYLHQRARRGMILLLRCLAGRHCRHWFLRRRELIVQFAVAYRGDQNIDDEGDLRLEFFYQPRQAGDLSCLSRASVTDSCFKVRSVLYSLRNIVNTHTTECSRGRKHLTVARGGKHADKLCGPWQFHAVQCND